MFNVQPTKVKVLINWFFILKMIFKDVYKKNDERENCGFSNIAFQFLLYFKFHHIMYWSQKFARPWHSFWPQHYMGDKKPLDPNNI